MNIIYIFIILFIIVSIIAFKVIRKYLLLERISRYENLRNILMYKLGVIKADSFSYVRLEKIYSRINKAKSEFKSNPHMVYEIITETEDDMDTYFN